MQSTLIKTLSLIILIAALGAGCGKKENTEAETPGAANPPGAVTPKPSPPEQKSKPLPPALVTAWEKSGFIAGWMGPRKIFPLLNFSEKLKVLDASKSVPAFRPRKWKPGMLKPLPAPTSAFGLDLSETKITDASLKEVAKLQQLTELNLTRCTQITDAGVAELRKALPKCEIKH